MNDNTLTEALAAQVFGWRPRRDRFITGGRSWIPRWRFQPTESLVDAFRLLEEAAPQEYSMCGGSKGTFRVQVRIGEGTGEAEGTSKARTITVAVARALALDVNNEGQLQRTRASREGSGT